MKSQSINSNSIEDLELQLDRLKDEFNPQLAFLFANVKCDIDKINKFLKDRNIAFIGCSTAGEIHNDSLTFDNIGMLLLEMDQSYFKIYHGEYSDSVFDSIVNLGETIKMDYENPGVIIFSGGILVDGYQIVQGLKGCLGESCPIYGGLGGNNLEFFKTNVYSTDFNSENGFSAVAFDTDKILLKGLAFSGWSGLGMNNIITKCTGNIVYEINGVPALDEIKKYFGEDMFVQPEQAGQDVIVFPGQFPLKIYRENGTAFLRAIVNVNLKEKSLYLAGGVSEGATFKYCPSPDVSVVDETVNLYREKLDNVDEINSVLMISCLIRYHSFGPLFEEEINAIYNLWNKPMSGFLSYGEIGNTGDGRVEFHNATCSLVSLSERAA